MAEPFDNMRHAMEDAAAAAFLHPSENLYLASIAISLKRIADVAQGFGDHPDNANVYGETGMRAVIGELGRFKNEMINEISMIMRRN